MFLLVLWVTNVSPIIQLGLQPVFCDINFKNFSFDEEHIKTISEDNPDIKAIFVTHLLGFYSNIPMLKKYFPNAEIMEDVCESHGCKNFEGQKTDINTLEEHLVFILTII